MSTSAVSTEIRESLLNAERLGQKQFNAFVQEIYMLSKDGSLHRKSCDSMKKTKTPTFASPWLKNKQDIRKSQLRLIVTVCYG